MRAHVSHLRWQRAESDWPVLLGVITVKQMLPS